MNVNCIHTLTHTHSNTHTNTPEPCSSFKSPSRSASLNLMCRLPPTDSPSFVGSARLGSSPALRNAEGGGFGASGSSTPIFTRDLYRGSANNWVIVLKFQKDVFQVGPRRVVHVITCHWMSTYKGCGCVLKQQVSALRWVYPGTLFVSLRKTINSIVLPKDYQ